MDLIVGWVAALETGQAAIRTSSRSNCPACDDSMCGQSGWRVMAKPPWRDVHLTGRRSTRIAQSRERFSATIAENASGRWVFIPADQNGQDPVRRAVSWPRCARVAA